MTMDRTFMKRHDLLPPIQKPLKLNGAVFPLDGFTIQFHMWLDGQSMKVDSPASIVDLDQALVQYDWLAGDTDTAGEFYCEWEARNEAGQPITFPNAPQDEATDPPHDWVLISEDGV